MSELVHDPLRRQRYRFNREGDILQVEIWIDPGGEVPEHVHPSQEERFQILDGRVRITVDGRKVEAGAGERATAPIGSRHRFENAGPGEAHMLVEVEPAGNLQQFLEGAAELARARRYTRRGPHGRRGRR
jgi:quercetin dioxygenase-like cupin family protein